MVLNFTSRIDGSNLNTLLTSLNGDNSWLLSIPCPPGQRTTRQKSYFHIVSDPWLEGPADTYHPWIISISRTETPAARNGVDVEAMALEIERAAALPKSLAAKRNDSPLIDLILINTNAHDHLNEATLRTFSRHIPVMTIKDCVAEVRSLGHFENVTVYPDLLVEQKNWQSLHPGDPMPSWLHIFRIGSHFLNFGTAVAWTHLGKLSEGVLSSPHGLRVDDPITQTFLGLQPQLSVLAMLHALHDSFAAGRRTTLGIDGGLALQRAINPKYWVPTHDQKLNYNGILMKLLRVVDVPRTLESALEAEKNKNGGIRLSATSPNIVDVANGSCFTLV